MPSKSLLSKQYICTSPVYLNCSCRVLHGSGWQWKATMWDSIHLYHLIVKEETHICVSLETIHKGYRRQINLAPWRQNNSFGWKGDSPQWHREKSPFILFLAEAWNTRRSSSPWEKGNVTIVADTTLVRDIQLAPFPILFLAIGFCGHLGFVIQFPKYTTGTTSTFLSACS